MAVVPADEQPHFDLSGSRITGVASPSRGASEVTVYRVEMLPGGSTPPHTHDHEEVFLLADGAVSAKIGDDHDLLETGDAIIIPAGVLHQVLNTGEGSARAIISVPAGTRMFDPDGKDLGVPPWGE